VAAAVDVAGVEVDRVEPGAEGHVGVFGAEGGSDDLGAFCVHVGEEAADEVGDEVGAERPGRTDVAEDPGEVGDAGEHHAAVGDGVAEGEGLAVDGDGDVAQDAEVEAGGGDDDVGLEDLAGLEFDALGEEAGDVAGFDGGVAGFDLGEEIGVGDAAKGGGLG